MGTLTIYWWPEGAASWASIPLPYATALDDAPYRTCSDSVGAVASRLDRGGGRMVRLTTTLNEAKHAETLRELRGLVRYLQAGGRLSLGYDDQMYLGAVATPWVAGLGTVDTPGNVLTYGSPTHTSGDRWRAERLSPLLEEHLLLSSITTPGPFDRLIFSTPPQQELAQGALVRPWRCFPSLFLPESEARSTERILNDARNPGFTFDVDMTLQELPHELDALVTTAGQMAGANLTTDQGGKSLNDIVARHQFTRVT